MTRSARQIVCACLAVAPLAAACAVEPGEENLKRSFAEQIEGVASVEGFEREGDTLRFTENRGNGDTVSWRVTIDTVAIARPGGAPVQGAVTSSWYADEQVIEPIGSMSRLPDAFLGAGVAQECYALWDENARAWDW